MGYVGIKHGAFICWVENKFDAYEYVDGTEVGEI
jgi:hypothetical protein